MSNQKSNRASLQPPSTHAVRARIEAELALGYVEVAPQGITLKEFFALYAALVREITEQALGSIRSLFRYHPAH